jgi:hypothetical protein
MFRISDPLFRISDPLFRISELNIASTETDRTKFKIKPLTTKKRHFFGGEIERNMPPMETSRKKLKKMKKKRAQLAPYGDKPHETEDQCTHGHVCQGKALHRHAHR